MRNEANGFAYLQAMNGQSAAHIYGLTQDAALVEYLPGPSLGELSRNNHDREAAAHLVAVANRLHKGCPKPLGHIQTVEHWLKALFDLEYSADVPPLDRAKFDRAKRLAQDLIASAEDRCFLHGDLHHDNIRKTERGYCAFDAKGVLGERAYELANAFRNPKGADQLVSDPNRVRFLRDLWSDAFQVPARRLMQWACVKSALSISWRAGAILCQDQEFELLEIFFGILDETP